MKKFLLSMLIGAFCFSVGTSQIVISEINYNPPGSDNGCEFIEIYNAYENDIDLSNWTISGGVDFIFPEGAIIESDSFVIVTRREGTNCGDYDLTGNPYFYSTGALNNAMGEPINLNDNCGNLITTVTYSVDPDWAAGDGNADGGGESLHLADISDDSDNLNWIDSLTPSPDTSAFLTVGTEEFIPSNCSDCDQTDCLVITEIMIDPCSGPGAFWPGEGMGEYIELYNNCDSAIDISGYRVKDDIGFGLYKVIPSGTVLDSGEFVVVGSQAVTDSLDKDGDNIIDGGTALIFGRDSNSPELANEGLEVLTLEDCAGNTIDSVRWTNAGCMSSNDGITAVLLDYEAENVHIDTANWFAGRATTDTIAGGGTPGEHNLGSACINNVDLEVDALCDDGPENGVTFTISFDYSFSADSLYFVYIDSVFLDTIGTYALGEMDSAVAEIFIPAPVEMGMVELELRGFDAARNPCYSADIDISVPECAEGPLPVELSNFNTRPEGCDVIVSWSTTLETNFDYFELERSIDGLTFERIQVISGEGVSGLNQYQHFDRNASSVNYYRLKMVDRNGSFEYSAIREATTDCVSETKLILYPNPVGEQQDEITLKYFSKDASTRLLIQDMHGRTLMEKQLETALGWNNQPLNISNLPAGVFVFTILESNGAKASQRLIRLNN